MSTHCGIGIKRKSGKVDATYCHFDGYLSGVGAKLRRYFTTPEAVSELVGKGDIRSINDDGSVEVFDDEVGFDTKSFRSLQDFLNDDLGTEEHTYVFDEDTNKWYYLGMEEDEDSMTYDDNMGMYVLDDSMTEGSDILDDYLNYKNGNI